MKEFPEKMPFTEDDLYKKNHEELLRTIMVLPYVKMRELCSYYDPPKVTATMSAFRMREILADYIFSIRNEKR